MVQKKSPSIEHIIRSLRKAEVMIGEGNTLTHICKQLKISDNTYYKWRKSYGGMSIDHAQRLKILEKENSQLKRAVADLTLDNLVLKDFKAGKL